MVPRARNQRCWIVSDVHGTRSDGGKRDPATEEVVSDGDDLGMEPIHQAVEGEEYLSSVIWTGRVPSISSCGTIDVLR